MTISELQNALVRLKTSMNSVLASAESTYSLAMQHEQYAEIDLMQDMLALLRSYINYIYSLGNKIFNTIRLLKKELERELDEKSKKKLAELIEQEEKEFAALKLRIATFQNFIEQLESKYPEVQEDSPENPAP
jgi:uncharacterized protein YhaN